MKSKFNIGKKNELVSMSAYPVSMMSTFPKSKSPMSLKSQQTGGKYYPKTQTKKKPNKNPPFMMEVPVNNKSSNHKHIHQKKSPGSQFSTIKNHINNNLDDEFAKSEKNLLHLFSRIDSEKKKLNKSFREVYYFLIIKQVS